MKKTLLQLSLVLIAITSSLSISSCTGDNDPAASTKNNITKFIFSVADNATLDQDVIGAIDIDSNAITLNVPFGTDITALQPTITISEGATIDPITTSQDFSTPVSYTITAEAGNTKTYTVTVTKESNLDSDREALIAIYNANPEPQEVLGWDINDPNLENWRGVQVTDGRVTGLFLGESENFNPFSLQVTLTSDIGDLTKLKKLGILAISISGLPDEMGNLKDFEELIAQGSNIQEIPSSMGQLKNFKRLSVRRNGLVALVVPDEVCALEKSGQLVIQTGGLSFDGPIPYCSSNR